MNFITQVIKYGDYQFNSPDYYSRVIEENFQYIQICRIIRRQMRPSFYMEHLKKPTICQYYRYKNDALQ